MSRTKEKILQASLHLFNTYGLSNITLRRIANHLEMSQGNLNYHYPKRETIVYALYLRLVDELETQLGDARGGLISFDLLFQITSISFNSLNKYKFLMLDFVQVMRQHLNVRKHYQELIQRRNSELGMMLQALVVVGLMQEEDYKNQYKNLSAQMSILGDSVLASFETIYDIPVSERAQKYVDLMTQMIYPYLTAEGKKMYWEAYRKVYPEK